MCCSTVATRRRIKNGHHSYWQDKDSHWLLLVFHLSSLVVLLKPLSRFKLLSSMCRVGTEVFFNTEFKRAILVSWKDLFLGSADNEIIANERFEQCVLFCWNDVFCGIVLHCIDGVVIAALMHCDLFEIYCAPPNLGIY
jgi:hypothetical protein